MQDRKDKWTVGQWMTSNPETVTPTTSVRTAFIEMRRKGFRHLPVIEEEKLVGMITDRDLRRPDITDDADGWNDYYNLDDDYEVRYVMATSVQTVTATDPLEKALKLFCENKYGALPVLNKNNELIGILSAYDALDAFSEALKISGEDLRKKS